jgi:hypothetical protein
MKTILIVDDLLNSHYKLTKELLIIESYRDYLSNKMRLLRDEIEIIKMTSPNDAKSLNLEVNELGVEWDTAHSRFHRIQDKINDLQNKFNLQLETSLNTSVLPEIKTQIIENIKKVL